MGMSVEDALVNVLDVHSPERRHSIRRLIVDPQYGLDARLMALLVDHASEVEIACVLCRILAEREPDRDPTYAFEIFLGSQAKRSGWRAAFMRRQMYRNPLALTFGICRLRKAKPVEHYARDLKHWSATRRLQAVFALGDTADPNGLPFVAEALRDRNWRVRAIATDSIRRLNRDADVGSQMEALIDPLLARLRDRKEEVVKHAAYALCDLGMGDSLERELDSLSCRSGVLTSINSALRGEVPPIPQTWVGEPTSGGL